VPGVWLVGLLGTLSLALFARPTSAPAQAAATPAVRGRVITVQGPIDPDSIGMTLMHEHLVSNMLLPDAATGYRGSGPLPAGFVRRFQESGRYFRVPRTPEQQAFWDRADLAPDMNGRLARGWLTRSMFVLDDARATLDELAAFKAAGGATVVDATTVGIGRDPERLLALAERSGVRVVMGTGWYRWPFHPPDVGQRTVDELARTMILEIEHGVGETGIRAGIIGEIPVDGAGLRLDEPESYVYPDSAIVVRRTEQERRIRSGHARLEDVYHEDELRVLRAAARASRATGVAITLHAPDPWLDYLDLLEREGADLHRVVVGHADQILLDDSLARAALARGVYLQLDYTLQRYAYGDAGPIDRLLDRMAWAIREGYEAQLLLSLDLCFRQGLARYGGGGYRSFTDRVLPGLRGRGVSEATIRRIVADNPRRVLTVTSPSAR